MVLQPASIGQFAAPRVINNHCSSEIRGLDDGLGLPTVLQPFPFMLYQENVNGNSVVVIAACNECV